MIIYKITNNINDKVYIGQTTGSLNQRWYDHQNRVKYKKKRTTPLYKAMKKYGIDNFKIEEIDGANNITELNYKEWLLVHKNNTLWPNGYNMMEGGGNTGKMSAFSRGKISQSLKNGYNNKRIKHPNRKQVVNIKTGEKYESCVDCARKNGIDRKYLSDMLIGRTNNRTNFRYLGQESVCKKPIGQGGKKRKPIIDVSTGKIYESISECARQNKIHNGCLSDILRGKRKNQTNFRYFHDPSDHLQDDNQQTKNYNKYNFKYLDKEK